MLAKAQQELQTLELPGLCLYHAPFLVQWTARHNLQQFFALQHRRQSVETAIT